MRALVTGGAGFIGSALVDRLLAEGHEVDVVDDLSTGSLTNLAQARAQDGPLTFQKMDIRLPELIDLFVHRRPDVVFHLGAQTSVNESVARPIFDADCNIIGTLRVLEAALAAKSKKVVFAASGGSLYGDGDDKTLPFNELSTFAPASPYAAAKRAVLDYLQIYRDLFGLDYTVLALANVYGPRQHSAGEAGVVSVFAEALLAQRAPSIYGGGNQTRDFVYVDDVVDAFARAGTRASGMMCNIGTGNETSVRTIYRAVARATGSNLVPVEGAAKPGDVRRNALDCTRAEKELGWRPWTRLEEGIEATVAYLRGQ